MATISLVSAGGGLRPLADQFVVSTASTTTTAAATADSAATAATANTTNALESTTGLVANVWA